MTIDWRLVATIATPIVALVVGAVFDRVLEKEQPSTWVTRLAGGLMLAGAVAVVYALIGLAIWILAVTSG